MNKLLSLIGIVSFFSVVFTVVTFTIFILDGFVIWYLWDWFVVKALKMPEINIWQAMGLSMIVSYLTYHYYPHKREEQADIIAPFCHAFVRPVIALLFGWLLHFMV
jgi:hypothetical protein